MELPAGEHQMTLQTLAGNGSFLGPAELVRIQVRDGRNTYVLANFPDAKLAGRIVTSGGK
jgi:hypothetical protein